MDWRRDPGTDPADPHGVADLLSRACDLVSPSAVEGTRFLFTTVEMLRVSREIEQASMVNPTDPLYVGVQHADRLEAQADVYRTLTGIGVEVLAFGCDHAPSIPDVRWVRVPEDPYALTASWFLVRNGATPHAVVGFELPGGPEAPRRWEGFETRNPSLIAGIIDHLCAVADGQGTREHSSGLRRC